MAKLQLKNVAKMATRNGEPNPMDSGIFDESGIIDESGLWEHDFTFIKEGEESFIDGRFAKFLITVGWDSGEFTQNFKLTKQEVEFDHMDIGANYTYQENSVTFEVTSWVGIISFNYLLKFYLTNNNSNLTKLYEVPGNFTIPPKYLVGSGAPDDGEE